MEKVSPLTGHEKLRFGRFGCEYFIYIVINVIVIGGKQLRRSPRVSESSVACFAYILCIIYFFPYYFIIAGPINSSPPIILCLITIVGLVTQDAS